MLNDTLIGEWLYIYSKNISELGKWFVPEKLQVCRMIDFFIFYDYKVFFVFIFALEFSNQRKYKEHHLIYILEL